MKRIKTTKKRNSDRPTKFVRIDPRTTIEVDKATPDAVAKRDFLLRLEYSRPMVKHTRVDNYLISE